MMESEVVGDFLSASRGLEQIEMPHPNASLLGVLTPHYCLAPETHLLEDVTTALLSSLLPTPCVPLLILRLRKKLKSSLTR